MACKLVRARLFEYMDGELPAEPRAQLEAHVTACADCRRLLDLERSFAEHYGQRLRPDPAPDRLRARVTEMLGAVPAVRPRRWGRRLALGYTLVAAGAVATLGLGALLAGGGPRFWRLESAPLGRLAAASVEQHQKLARGILPHDITQVTPKAAEQWFKSRLNFNVNLPELTREDLDLVGGRIAHLRDLEVAALHFKMDGRDISLFVIPFEKYRDLGIDATPKFKMVTHQGYDVIVWASHGMAYSLVSEIGGRSCLVCHSRDEPLGLPADARAHDRL